jgi:transposase InsO family protein
MKYACIMQYRQQFPVALMCRVLGVSRAGFYAAQHRPVSQRAHADQRLRLAIRVIHHRSRATYGSPRIHAGLRAQGVRCSRKRVARWMQVDGLRAKVHRRFRATTNSNHAHAIAPNHLARRFAVTEVADLNLVWASDITYVPTREAWLYLAVILDLASRRVVGWSMQPPLAQSLTIDALAMALRQRCPSPGVMHHSDRGVQYAAMNYQALLAGHGMTPSMSRKGDCYDNAVVESFFATLEWELIEDADWHTRAQARTAIFEYIEVWGQSATSTFNTGLY